MVNSSIGSNFHRRSGDDQRRGIFSKLPPLSIPNGLRRLTSGSPKDGDKKSSPSLKSSTSSAIISIGSVLALVPAKKSSTDSSQPKSSVATASTQTPSSSLPLSAFSLPPSNRSSVNTQITSPGSGKRDNIDFIMRPGVLPDPSPHKTYFPLVHTKPDGQADVKWEERRYSSINKRQGSEGGPVLMHMGSPADASPSPRIFDATLNRISVAESLQDAEIAMKHLEQLKLIGGPKDKSTSDGPKVTVKPQETSINWDPSNPGHDTWNESGRDEKWQQRSQLFSNLSAFNMRSAQKRKTLTPKVDIGPVGEAVDPTNDPLTLRDVGGLAEKDRCSAAGTPLLRPEATLPCKTPLNSPVSPSEGGLESAQLPKVKVSFPKESPPRNNVAMPCSEDTKNDEENQKQQRQSLFDMSDDEDIDSEDDEDSENDEDEEDCLSSLPDDPDNEISHSIKSRTAKDSTRASLLHRSSSLRPVRSRGVSIGLEDCSQDPMVLAAGFEKKLRGSKRLTMSGDAGGNRRECYVYRSSEMEGRETSWEICPGREALGVERARSQRAGVGRNRGETV